MLEKKQIVVVDRFGKDYETTVIGSDGEHFWLLLAELGEVIRGHTAQLFSHAGTNYLRAAEWHGLISSMFDESGGFTSTAFFFSRNPQPMINYLRTHQLIARGSAPC